MVYFTSDLHLGHKSIAKYREPFDTVEEHDEFVFKKLEELGKRDILFVLGDFLFDGEHYKSHIERISKLTCRIKLIMGNHDSKLLYSENCIEMQLPLYSYKSFWLSHCPIHPGEMRNRKGNLHGHLHHSKIDDKHYFNVNLDVNNYEFVNFEKIKEYFKQNQ